MYNILENSMEEIYKIVAECNYELIIIESSNDSDSDKIKKKKDVLTKKSKQILDVFKKFSSKWWDEFISLIKTNKVDINNSDTEVTYCDFTEYVNQVGEALKHAKATGDDVYISTDIYYKKGTAREAVKSLEECATQMKKYIDELKNEKDEDHVNASLKNIKEMKRALAIINSELKKSY